MFISWVIFVKWTVQEAWSRFVRSSESTGIHGLRSIGTFPPYNRKECDSLFVIHSFSNCLHSTVASILMGNNTKSNEQSTPRRFLIAIIKEFHNGKINQDMQILSNERIPCKMEYRDVTGSQYNSITDNCSLPSLLL